MKPLILTNSSSRRMRSELADVAIDFCFRFVPGTLPPQDELATYVAARSEKHGPAEHWSDFVGRWPLGDKARRDCGLLEFCQPYEAIEFWFDLAPNDQLQQIWLLDHSRSHPGTAAKLRLRIVDFDLSTMEQGPPESLDEVPVVDVTTAEFETASMSWQAYRAATPEACFDLLHRDLSALPLLKPAMLDLLEELPASKTGLGATEMRLLELIGAGYSHPNALFYERELRQRRVFNAREIGCLLQGLAHSPQPAVVGLDEEFRVLDQENYAGRHAAFLRSRLSLTKFGDAILAHKEDFSRHNPIDRWWGTHLTNDRLWRWSPALMKPQSSGGQ
jgi:hypothetical protein